jgi:hypothetical protein
MEGGTQLILCPVSQTLKGKRSGGTDSFVFVKSFPAT